MGAKQHPLISVSHLSKSFAGYQALTDIALDIHQGQVHCLAGTNGCGKSTLIKVISGFHKPDEGSAIYINGKRIRHFNPELAKKHGIQVIYQDLALFPNLSAAENIAFDLNMAGFLKWHSRRRLNEKARQMLDEMQFDIDLSATVGDLTIAQRQQVAICRALVARAHLVIMDEPTASLTRNEVSLLLKTIHRLKHKNIGVIFVSHRLDEVLEISDTVTVIRDGMLIGSYAAEEVSPLRLSELMTGVVLQQTSKTPRSQTDKVVLNVKKLTKHKQYHNISFKIYRGEVVGLCGLLGSGRTELALSLFGISRPDSGQIYLNNIAVTFKNPSDAVKSGVGYVPEDRLNLGLVMAQSVADNIVLSTLGELKTNMHFIDESRKKKIVEQWIKQLDIRVSNADNPVSTLSGGNQQKVVLAKWILTQPKLLILDAPTVGVDIAAKNSIYELIHQLADKGIAVLLISDEIQEAYYNCDRILHIEHGEIINEYHSGQIGESRLQEMING